MKRSAILSLTIVFAMSALTAAPVSFAEENNDSKTIESSEIYNSVLKDTSWFDYENPKDTYEISTEAQLLGLASLVNENQADKWKPTRIENFENVTFILTNDIRLTGNWTPIGSGSASYFAGVFDGNGHTISGLDIESSTGFAGLFGYLVGEVKDLTVSGKIKSGDGNCGGIAGQLTSTAIITGCTTDVTISAKDKTGGVAGYNDGGTIESCINLGNISGTYKVGGVVGENWGGKINKCGNRGEVKSSKRGVATYGTGGIAGRSVSAEARITRSYNYGKIISDTEGTGGIVGYMNAEGATVKECYNNAEINIINKTADEELSKSYAGGIAGIVGANGVIVRNCYNCAEILNADTSGGIIGRYINDSDNAENISYIRNNYYLSNQFKSGIGYTDDAEDRKAAKATMGISTGSMSSLASSLSAEYRNDTGIYGNGGYPVLIWQEPASEEEKTYIAYISREIQHILDKYVIDSTKNSPYGQGLIKFFTPVNYTNDSIMLYNEAIDKYWEKEE